MSDRARKAECEGYDATCQWCGKKGHTARACQQKGGATHCGMESLMTVTSWARAGAKKGGGAKRIEKRTCYQCDRPGHIVRECNRKSIPKEEKHREAEKRREAEGRIRERREAEEHREEAKHREHEKKNKELRKQLEDERRDANRCKEQALDKQEERDRKSQVKFERLTDTLNEDRAWTKAQDNKIKLERQQAVNQVNAMQRELDKKEHCIAEMRAEKAEREAGLSAMQWSQARASAQQGSRDRASATGRREAPEPQRAEASATLCQICFVGMKDGGTHDCEEVGMELCKRCSAAVRKGDTHHCSATGEVSPKAAEIGGISEEGWPALPPPGGRALW
jgi:hypothetical protein